jgi:hypothetical protein
MTLSSNYVIETLAGAKCLATDHREMAKNVKSLIIFARDCLKWSCLGVSSPKFEILPNSSDQVDMKLTYFNQLTESFLSPKCRNSAGAGQE